MNRTSKISIIGAVLVVVELVWAPAAAASVDCITKPEASVAECLKGTDVAYEATTQVTFSGAAGGFQDGSQGRGGYGFQTSLQDFIDGCVVRSHRRGLTGAASEAAIAECIKGHHIAETKVETPIATVVEFGGRGGIWSRGRRAIVLAMAALNSATPVLAADASVEQTEKSVPTTMTCYYDSLNCQGPRQNPTRYR